MKIKYNELTTKLSNLIDKGQKLINKHFIIYH